MKSKQEKEEILENLYDSIMDFQLLGLVPVLNIMNYLDSPGLYRFYDTRIIKFHELSCYNFVEAEKYKDLNRLKIIKWLHINLTDFYKLIDEFRKIEKRVYEVLAKNVDDDILYTEISKLICEMQIILVKLKEHCIQTVDDKLQEIANNLQEPKVFSDFTGFTFEYERINQDFILSLIELYPEISNTDIEDIKQYLSQDFYFNDENENLDIILNKMEELK